MSSKTKYIDWFRETAPYINQHRGKSVVIMLPGEFAQAPFLQNVVSDIAVLHSLGLKLVLVHGARQQIDEALTQRGFESTMHKGIRVTPAEHLQAVIAAVAATRSQIEASFSCGLPNSPLHGSRLRIRSGNFVSAKPCGVVDGIDYQFTGAIRSIDAIGVRSLIDDGSIVLLSPTAYSLTGDIFNVSFADVAVKVASAIGADKLVTYNDDGQIKDARGHAYREMTLLQCKKFLVETQQHARSNTYFSLQACHEACDQGIPRAHIISAEENGSILRELFTRDGTGTMVYRDSYETVRRARIEDVAGILALIEPLEDGGVLVKRSRERLETEIAYFTVMEKENLIIACSALYPVPDSKFGEIACVAVHPDYRGSGRAKKLLTHLERQAAKLGLHTLFVLTTQTAHWFIELGFAEIHVDSLPAQRKELYNWQRMSKVFSKRVRIHASTVDL